MVQLALRNFRRYESCLFFVIKDKGFVPVRDYINITKSLGGRKKNIGRYGIFFVVT